MKIMTKQHLFFFVLIFCICLISTGTLNAAGPIVNVEFFKVSPKVEIYNPVKGTLSITVKNIPSPVSADVIVGFMSQWPIFQQKTVRQYHIESLKNGEYKLALLGDLNLWAELDSVGKYTLGAIVVIHQDSNKEDFKGTAEYPVEVVNSTSSILILPIQGTSMNIKTITVKPYQEHEFNLAYIVYRNHIKNDTVKVTESVKLEGHTFKPLEKTIIFKKEDGYETVITPYKFTFSQPGLYILNYRVECPGANPFFGKICYKVTSIPEITGSLAIATRILKTGDALSGKIQLDISQLKEPRDVFVRLTVSGYNKSDQETSLSRNYTIPNAVNQAYELDIERELPTVLNEAGTFSVKVIACFPDANTYEAVTLGKVEITVKDMPKAIKELSKSVILPQKDSLNLMPFPEFCLEYKVEGIKTGKPINVIENIKLMKAAKKKSDLLEWNTLGTISEKSTHSTPGLEENFYSNYYLKNLLPGNYRIDYSVESPGFPTLTGNIPFEIAGEATSPQPQMAPKPPPVQGPIFKLTEVQVDRDKKVGVLIGGGKVFTSITKNSATAIRPPQNPTEHDSITVAGEPPELLYPGVKFDITVSVSATGDKKEGFRIDSGIEVHGAIKAVPAVKDKFRATAGSGEFSGSDSVTYHCSVTEDSAKSYNSASLIVWIGSGPYMVIYNYEKVNEEKNETVNQTANINNNTVSTPVPPVQIIPVQQLQARLDRPTLELVPGEISKISGIYISGWRCNTEDRVYIDVPTKDAWGSLQVNPNIVIFSGHWSLAPEHMQREEHGVSLFWSARSTATPGTFQIPITISQKGSGKVVLTQTIRIIPPPHSSVTTTGSSAPTVSKDDFTHGNINQSSTEATTAFNRGMVFVSTGQWTQAELEFRNAVQLDPSKGEYQLWLGNACGNLQKWDDAERAYRKCIQLTPANSQGYSGLAWVLSIRKQWEQCAEAYRKAIRLDSKNAVLHYYLGNTYFNQKKWSEAVAEYKDAISLSPTIAAYYFSLGQAYGWQGKWSEAQSSYEKAIKLEPANAAMHDALGSAYYNEKKLTEAEVQYREAIRLDNFNGIYHANLAGVLFSQNNRVDALTEAKEAIKLGCRQHWVYAELNLNP